MYEIILSQNAERQLRKLEKRVQERIISVLERIRVRPEHFISKLVGEPGYKLRIGDHRVILDILPDRLLILVVKVGHRKNIYKYL